MKDICRICKKEKETFISSICKNCFDKTNASFDKNNPYNKITIISCNKHGLYMGGSYNASCPLCIEEQRFVKCEICNQKFRSSKRLDHIFDSTNICEICFNKLPGKGKNIKKCNKHSFYKAISGNDKCPICYNKEVFCSNPNCNKLLNFKILENDNQKYYCSNKCANIINNKIKNENNQKPGICYNCGKFVQNRTSTTLGIDCGCIKIILTKHNQSKLMRESSKEKAKILHTYHKEFCKECGKITLHNYYNSCVVCIHKYQDYSHLAFHFEFCNKCKKDTLHNGSICCICNPKSGNGFNREEFYKNKFNIISFESMNKNIYLEDFDSLKSKLGV